MVVNSCFTGAISRIEGIGFDEIAREALIKHNNAFRPVMKQDVLQEGGVYQWKTGEYHQYNPNTVHLLQQATWKTIMKFSRNIPEQLMSETMRR